MGSQDHAGILYLVLAGFYYTVDQVFDFDATEVVVRYTVIVLTAISAWPFLSDFHNMPVPDLGVLSYVLPVIAFLLVLTAFFALLLVLTHFSIESAIFLKIVFLMGFNNLTSDFGFFLLWVSK